MAAAKEINFPPAVEKKYAKGDEIARGKFGVVYRCTSRATSEALAVKVMLKRGNKVEDVQREVSILQKLNHPGILQMKEYLDSGDVYVLVMELLNGPELFDYLTEKDFLEEKEARFYMKQLLEATAYMHKNKIIHLDLKPENIVMKSPSGEQLKIIDFGAARDLSKNSNPKVLVGTPEFVAPEVLNFEPACAASDIWAIGVMAYVIMTGMSPFLGDTDSETMINISSGEFDYPDPEEGCEDISDQAKSFIDSMVKLNPKDRPDAQKVLVHDWMETSESKRMTTARLKSFKARRRWLAVTKAARISVSLGRLSLKRNGTTTTTGSPNCDRSATLPASKS